MTIYNLRPVTHFSPEVAEKLAAQLNADPEEDWTYTVERHGESAFRVIRVTDGNGFLLGYF